MELDQIYEQYVLGDKSENDVSEVKKAFDSLRMKLHRLSLQYNMEDDKVLAKVVEDIFNQVGDSLGQYEHMLVQYFPGQHVGLKK